MSEYEDLKDENEKLRAFANQIMETWSEGGLALSLDILDIQEIAEQHELLVQVIRHEPCSNEYLLCRYEQNCTSEEFIEGVECFQKTPLLTGK